MIARYEGYACTVDTISDANPWKLGSCEQHRDEVGYHIPCWQKAIEDLHDSLKKYRQTYRGQTDGFQQSR